MLWCLVTLEWGTIGDILTCFFPKVHSKEEEKRIDTIDERFFAMDGERGGSASGFWWMGGVELMME